MLRFRSTAAAVGVSGVIMGLALSGCSSSDAPSWMPEWMTIKPPLQPLKFESEPPGADVTVAAITGQTCKTPCSLAVPLTNQSVTFSMNGYLPQTLSVEVHNSTDFEPNPVQASLQVAPSLKKGKPKRRATPPKTAAARQ